MGTPDERSKDSRAPRLFLAIGVIFALAYSVALVVLGEPDGRIVKGDAPHYYVYLRSFLFDGDLHFENDYLVLYGLSPDDPKVREIYGITPTGRPGNAMSVGPAILWSPFFLLAAAGVWLANLFGAGYPLDGFGSVFQASTGYAGIAAATAGAALGYRLCRVWFPAAPSLGATLAIWLGASPLYYSLVSPTYSHAVSMLVVGLLFLTWARTRDDFTVRRFALLGALGGLCALVRWQDAVFLILPAIDGLRRLVEAPEGRAAAAREVAARGAACTAAALAVFVPQMIAWTALYGAPFTMPHHEGWMEWGSPKLLRVLFSDRNGLLSWTPVVALALGGLVLLGRRDRYAGWMLGLSFLLCLYASAAPTQWWAGAAYGARRLVSCFPVFAVGLAALFDRLGPRAARGIAVVFIILNGLLLFQYQLAMRGFEEVAPYPEGFYGLFVARFVVPLRFLGWLPG